MGNDMPQPVLPNVPLIGRSFAGPDVRRKLIADFKDSLLD